MKKAMTKKRKATKTSQSNRKLRIKVAIVGSDSITLTQATDAAQYLIPHLLTKYDVRLIATVKEDLLGREMRFVARSLGIKIKTYAAADRADQSNSLELATASLLWTAKRFVVVIGSGRIEGCAKYAMEMLARTKICKTKILELKD